jgi:hypothetical protein
MKSATSLRHETKGRSNRPQLFAPARHEAGEGVGLAGLEFDPAVHVHAAEEPGGVHAVVHVGLFDVVHVGGAGAGEQVAVAGGIDHHVGHDRHAAFLALEHHALDGAVLHDRNRGPRVVDELDLALQHDLLREQLQALGVDGGRPGDDAVIGGGALRPVRGLGRVLRAPVLALRAGDGVGGQAIEQFFGEAADHQLAFPVGHAVDPDHQAAGRQGRPGGCSARAAPRRRPRGLPRRLPRCPKGPPPTTSTPQRW